MSPEVKTYEESGEKPEVDTKEQFKEQNVKPENADVVKRLGFHLEKGEKIDQKTLEGKMSEQFDGMKNSVGNNPESQAKLDAVQKTFMQTLGKDTDINAQLELCEEFLKEYDIAASTEKAEYIQRANTQSKNMEEDAQSDAKKTGDKSMEIKKMIASIIDLQLQEETKKREEKQRHQTEIQRVVHQEQISATTSMAEFQKPNNFV